MTTLLQLVTAELDQPVTDEVRKFAAEIAAKYGGASEAVLFYGSCLRERQLDGLMLDFYLIVDDYARAYDKAWLARANRLIPPNVFYAERGSLRAKYAVMSRADFDAACGGATRSVSVWARFAQPSRLVWCRGQAARAGIVRAVAKAAPTLLAAARPVLARELSIEALWTGAFSLTYAAELRSERAARGASLFSADPQRYIGFTGPALKEAGIAHQIDKETVRFTASANPAAGARAWKQRRAFGKRMSMLRLAKASLTFDGGIDYLAWKINRHAGADICITPWQRRHPILAGLYLLPKLKRQGAVK